LRCSALVPFALTTIYVFSNYRLKPLIFKYCSLAGFCEISRKIPADLEVKLSLFGLLSLLIFFYTSAVFICETVINMRWKIKLY